MTHPASKALDWVDPMGFWNSVIVAVPFDCVISREEEIQS